MWDRYLNSCFRKLHKAGWCDIDLRCEIRSKCICSCWFIMPGCQRNMSSTQHFQALFDFSLYLLCSLFLVNSLLECSQSSSSTLCYTDLIAQPVTRHPFRLKTTYTTRNGAHERNIFWKGGRDVVYLVPTKSFYSQSQQLLCMYFSLRAKAHSPPSIIPFPLAQDLYPQHIMPCDIKRDDDFVNQ